MKLKLPLGRRSSAILTSAYAPTMINTYEVKEKLYEELEALISVFKSGGPDLLIKLTELFKSDQWSKTRLRPRPHAVQPDVLGEADDAFRETSLGISIRYWYDKKLFKPRRLEAVTKVKDTVIRDLRFADDCALNASNEQKMQLEMDGF